MPSPAPRPGFPRRTVLAAGAALPLAAVGLAACAGDEDQDGAAFEPDLLSDVDREQPGPADEAGAFLTPFAARMLGALPREEINLVCSPLSAQVALTMAGLGAGGATRSQMEEVLGGSIGELAAAANTLSAGLAAGGTRSARRPPRKLPNRPSPRWSTALGCRRGTRSSRTSSTVSPPTSAAASTRSTSRTPQPGRRGASGSTNGSRIPPTTSSRSWSRTGCWTTARAWCS